MIVVNFFLRTLLLTWNVSFWPLKMKKATKWLNLKFCKLARSFLAQSFSVSLSLISWRPAKWVAQLKPIKRVICLPGDEANCWWETGEGAAVLCSPAWLGFEKSLLFHQTGQITRMRLWHQSLRYSHVVIPARWFWFSSDITCKRPSFLTNKSRWPQHTQLKQCICTHCRLKTQRGSQQITW